MSFDNYLSKANATLIAEILTLRAEIAAKDKSIHELEEMVSATEEERNDILCAKDKEIADLKHDIARHLTIASDAETYAAAKDKELALFKAVENHLPSTWAIGEDATAELALGLANRDKEIARLRAAIEEISALNVVVEGNAGPVVCSREIDAIVYAALATGARERSEDEKKEGLGAVDALINPAAGARPGAGDIPEAPPEKL